MANRYQRLGLHHLRYFAAVAEVGSFRRAAANLRIAQPALSRAVQQLETDLGCALLSRTRAGVGVTTDGQRVLERAGAILEAFDRLGDGIGNTEASTVRIGHVLPEYLRAGQLATAMREFRNAHPGIELEVVPMLHRRMLAALSKSQLDVGFAWLPLEDVPPELHLDVVLMDEPVVALAAAHRHRERRSIRLSELKNEPVILFPRRAMPERYDEIVTMLDRAKGGHRITAGPPNLRDVLAAVSRGEGFSIVPRIAAEAHRALGIVLKSIDGVGARWNLAMLAPARPRSTAAGNVVAALREQLRVG